jgi:hypothetical protein
LSLIPIKCFLSLAQDKVRGGVRGDVHLRSAINHSRMVYLALNGVWISYALKPLVDDLFVYNRTAGQPEQCALKSHRL